MDAAIEQQESRLNAQRARVQQVQPDFFEGAPPVQEEMDFTAAEARTGVQELLEKFLNHHTGANDLGLRLYGEQLAVGVRFVRMLKEDAYDLVIANPPYQGTGKMASSEYVEVNYQLGKNDLYASFLLRGLELIVVGGISTMLSMRSWMFLRQPAELRAQFLSQHTLLSIGDFDRGAFEGIADEVVSVCASVLRQSSPLSNSSSLVICPTPREDNSRDSERTSRKRSATLAHERVYRFSVQELKVVPEWPLIYWWTNKDLDRYRQFPLLGDSATISKGITTCNDTRFPRYTWEINNERIWVSTDFGRDPELSCIAWAPFLNGAKGAAWLHPTREAVRWELNGMEIANSPVNRYGRGSEFCFKRGVSFSQIGSSFLARLHRHQSALGNKGTSVFPENPEYVVCLLNSTASRFIASSLNPGLGFEVGDIQRIPLANPSFEPKIIEVLELSFSQSEKSDECSTEFHCPGPSSWLRA